MKQSDKLNFPHVRSHGNDNGWIKKWRIEKTPTFKDKCIDNGVVQNL